MQTQFGQLFFHLPPGTGAKAKKVERCLSEFMGAFLRYINISVEKSSFIFVQSQSDRCKCVYELPKAIDLFQQQQCYTVVLALTPGILRIYVREAS